MNFITLFGMICSVAMCTNLTKTGKNINTKNNDFAVQFYKRFFNTETSKLLFSTNSKTIDGKRSGKINGKLDDRMVGKKAKQINSKKRIIPARLCTIKNCYNCNHGLLRNIFKTKSKEERYCKIFMVAPDCCHNYFINHGFTF